ncbi:hypothetical protein Rxyl_1887 [Rubrobacter xylanophilus DSM 9941]|uniref:Uncharacterized protein n=1 Tax=Rubrobacter xylanophilus (strain DSM 9941 / JCM 11954 / NBRC 16129 / PRD-1) TaxID=266117 RepID=Q1AUU1_RUBXD|nr:hypothetical protein Rxyl_1887 [Rubrobacter xylanophilus DSM 9941]
MVAPEHWRVQTGAASGARDYFLRRHVGSLAAYSAENHGGYGVPLTGMWPKRTDRLRRDGILSYHENVSGSSVRGRTPPRRLLTFGQVSRRSLFMTGPHRGPVINRDSTSARLP